MSGDADRISDDRLSEILLECAEEGDVYYVTCLPARELLMIGRELQRLRSAPESAVDAARYRAMREYAMETYYFGWSPTTPEEFDKGADAIIEKVKSLVQARAK